MIHRTTKEIEDKLDELAYFEFCEVQGGSANSCGACKLAMLNWLLNTDYKNLYERGEKLYKSGVRYSWISATREYQRIKIDEKPKNDLG